MLTCPPPLPPPSPPLPRTPMPCLCKHTLNIMYIMLVFLLPLSGTVGLVSSLLCSSGSITYSACVCVCVFTCDRPIETQWGEQVWSRAWKRASDSTTRRIYNTAHHKGRILRTKRRGKSATWTNRRREDHRDYRLTPPLAATQCHCHLLTPPFLFLSRCFLTPLW